MKSRKSKLHHSVVDNITESQPGKQVLFFRIYLQGITRSHKMYLAGSSYFFNGKMSRAGTMITVVTGRKYTFWLNHFYHCVMRLQSQLGGFPWNHYGQGLNSLYLIYYKTINPLWQSYAGEKYIYYLAFCQKMERSDQLLFLDQQMLVLNCFPTMMLLIFVNS